MGLRNIKKWQQRWWTGHTTYDCFLYSLLKPIPVAARSNEWVCGRSLVGVVGSNPARGLDVSFERCVLSGRGLCVGLITCPESYRVWCVWVWPWNLDNEKVLAHWGLLRHGRKKALLQLNVITPKRGIMLSYVVKFVPWIWFTGSSEYITCLLKCLSTYCLWRKPQCVFSYPEDHLGWLSRKSWMAVRLSLATGEAGGSVTMRNIHVHGATKCEFNPLTLELGI
jgi:hypothetical protein